MIKESQTQTPIPQLEKEKTMNRSILIFVMVVLFAAAPVSFAQTQTMKGAVSGKSSVGKTDSTSASAANKSDVTTTMNEACRHYTTTISEFDRLQQHYDKMMQISDPVELKTEMQKHQSMMADMRKNMVEQETMMEKVMSEMGATDTSNRTQKVNKTTTGKH
jgi:hypothetical protein